MSSLALALSRASFPVLRFLPLVGPVLRSVRSGAPVQGFQPSAKRFLLVAGRCLLAVDSAPLTGFRQLPRTLRVDFEALFLAEIARPAPVLPGVGLASPLQASSRVGRVAVAG